MLQLYNKISEEDLQVVVYSELLIKLFYLYLWELFFKFTHIKKQKTYVE